MAWPYDSGLTVPPDAQPPDLYTEPTELTAGDSAHWFRVLPDYPAGTWTITYYLVGGPTQTSFTSSASGTDHEITLTAAVTGEWQPGAYRLVGLASDGTNRHRIHDGPLTVLQDPAKMIAGQDLRTHAQRTLALIESVIEGRATDDILNSSIEGTTISRLAPTELLALRDRYRAEVRTEKAQDAAKSGKASGRIILARFVQTS